MFRVADLRFAKLSNDLRHIQVLFKVQNKIELNIPDSVPERILEEANLDWTTSDIKSCL
jgi:hypothetical protein